MTNPTTLTSRRTRLIGVLLILAVGTAAMLALIATERVSAQAQQAATPEQVATEFDPPVLVRRRPLGWRASQLDVRRERVHASGLANERV